MLTYGSLFSGIGGIDLACEWAGMEVIWQCEKDPYCQKVLKKHWPEVKMYDDIHEIHRDNTLSPDVIVGGFPCQPFSVAGKRRGKEDDRDLWPEMFRVIQELKPRWVVGENVANFVRMELERTLLNLEGEGYETQSFIIPACGVGALHRRERFFVVANAEGAERQRTRHSWSRWDGFTNHRCYVPDTEGTRFEKWASSRRDAWQGSEPLEGIWESEPDVGRVATGIPRRVDRLRALGNAVVPQQIYPIMKSIAQIEQGLIK